MTPEIVASWRRIDAWLAEHAPVDLAALAPPVTDGELTAAEQVVGAAFPRTWSPPCAATTGR